jgi:hypothetical protein
MERGYFPVWLRHVGWVGALLASAYSFQAAFRGGESLGKWEVLRGHESRDNYLANRHMSYGQPHFAAMEYINNHLPKDSKVLFLGESRSYYCERDFVASTVFDHNPFWVAARKAKNASDLFAEVKAMGVTHVFLNVNQLFENSGLQAVMPRDVIAGPAFVEFWGRYLKKIFEKREKTETGQIKEWLVVYELRDGAIEDINSASENIPLLVLMELKRKGR